MKINKINILLLISLILLNNCAVISFRKEGVFKKPYKYTHFPFIKMSTVEIDDEKIIFLPLGGCGTQIGFFAFLLPIPLFPVEFHKNTCETKGFIISTRNKTNINYSKISFELKYEDTIYKSEKERDYAYFKIPNFEEFKKAQDKTLIIHKKRDDGTIITKEIPFDWKVVFHS